jgi:FdhD protein
MYRIGGRIEMMTPTPNAAVRWQSVVTHTAAGASVRQDAVAVEEPLEIRVGHGPLGNRSHTSVAVTMRTPGHDADLAVGFLWGEGIVDDPAEVIDVVEAQAADMVRVDLAARCVIDLDRLKRNVFVSSSCGVCGKTALAAVEAVCEPITPGMTVVASVIPRPASPRLAACTPRGSSTPSANCS